LLRPIRQSLYCSVFMIRLGRGVCWCIPWYMPKKPSQNYKAWHPCRHHSQKESLQRAHQPPRSNADWLGPLQSSKPQRFLAYNYVRIATADFSANVGQPCMRKAKVPLSGQQSGNQRRIAMTWSMDNSVALKGGRRPATLEAFPDDRASLGRHAFVHWVATRMADYGRGWRLWWSARQNLSRPIGNKLAAC
jgi:hypothetical protein